MGTTSSLSEQVAALPDAQRTELYRVLLSYPAFRRTYRDDPTAFVHDCFTWPDGESPAPYQDEILDALVRRKRVAVRGPHGIGKSAISAWAILWLSLTRDGAVDWKIPVTASAWRQVSHFLFPEVHKWAKRLRWDKIGRPPFRVGLDLLGLNLKLTTGEAFGMASDTPALIEGAHATAIEYIFDEAKTIHAALFDAAEGAFSAAGGDTSAEAFAVCISTPGAPNGRFYEIHARKPGLEDWWTRHVTLEEAIAAGRISREWAEQRRRQWGESSAVYQNRVLGEFAAGDEDGVIPLAWVELANERWREWQEVTGGHAVGKLTTIGVDVARGGEAQTVLALREGVVITELRRYAKQDTMATVGCVHGVIKAQGGRAIVDVIGLGAGVFDRLRELGASTEAFNAAAKTDATDRSGELGFTNLRGAAWWLLRERLDPSSDERLALPPDDRLTGDLTAPTWRVGSGGKIEIESKDTILARLGRSTDDGDAVVMAFADRLVTPDRVAAASVSAWGAATEEFTRSSYWRQR